MLLGPVAPPRVCLSEQKLRLLLVIARLAGETCALPGGGVEPLLLGLPLGVFLLVAASVALRALQNIALVQLIPLLVGILGEATLFSAAFPFSGLLPPINLRRKVKE